MALSIHHLRYAELRKHLKSMRIAAGLTQAEIAGRLKVEQSQVSKIERGERYVEMFFYVDWCRACGVATAAALKVLEKTAPDQPAVPTRTKRSKP